MRPLRYVMLGNSARQANLLWAGDDGNDLHGEWAATIQPPFAGSGGGPTRDEWRGFVDGLVGAWNNSHALKDRIAMLESVLRQQKITPTDWPDFWEMLDSARRERNEALALAAGHVAEMARLRKELLAEHQFLGDACDVHVVWRDTEALLRRRRGELYAAIVAYDPDASAAATSRNGRGESCVSNVVEGK